MRKQPNRTVVIAAMAVAGLVASACGSDETGVAPPATGSAIPPTTSPPAAGWIGGEPDWSSADGGARVAGGDVPADAAVPEELDAAVEPAPGGGGDAVEPPPDAGPLRAGSVDDNADYEGYLAYLDRLAGSGIAARPLDASRRSIVTVVGSDGRPVLGAEVVAVAGEIGVSMRTTADGTARFHPGFHGIDAAAVTFRVGDVETTVDVGTDATIEVDVPGGVDGVVPLDVLFLLDATGSMGDEIDRLKATIDTVAERVAALEPAPDVRFAMTLYRDEGDAFLTASHDFTGDVAAFRSALAEVVADGGGDYPEALDEGLAEALSAPAWRDPAATVQLVFVVADAPPQVARQVPVPYTESIVEAVGRGVKIFPVASSESDDQAELVFRQLAQATGAPFVFLSYGAAGAATGESTDIATTDYEELALDELVVRLIAEELDALVGDATPVTVPPTTPPPTTNPDGQ